MNPLDPLPLLGGLAPAQFMTRFWQKKPLLIRQALSGVDGLVGREDLFALAAQEHVLSRLIQRVGRNWTLAHGPFRRRALPALRQPDWTLLVQGVDLHLEAVHQLMQRFRFLPDARLDDVMISYASVGGGVGPHFDSYDVFLLQTQGRRRWRIGRAKDKTLRSGLPLRILARFVAEQEYLLAPGDMLYLPPGYAHDGVALDDCVTCSIGFRAPGRRELGLELLQRMAEAGSDFDKNVLYRDAAQTARARPAQLPRELKQFAEQAVRHALRRPRALSQALGEYLSEPARSVWFDSQAAPRAYHGVMLDRKTRMLYDGRHIFVNGESYRAARPDAGLMQRFADQRQLCNDELSRASPAARALIKEWIKAGWAHGR